MPRKTKEQKELENKSTTKSTTKPKTTKKVSTTTSKKTTTKTTVSTAKKKVTTKKETVSKKKTSTTKKAVQKKTTQKKKVEILEYYDLPYRYNQTIIKVLAQTPTNLFIYWDISDTDRKNLKKLYGNNFGG